MLLPRKPTSLTPISERHTRLAGKQPPCNLTVLSVVLSIGAKAKSAFTRCRIERSYMDALAFTPDAADRWRASVQRVDIGVIASR
jgi:hypothetical protein